MVTIAILAIIIAIAMPSYQNYIIKSRLIQIVEVLDSYLTQVKQVYLSSNTIPSTVNDLTSGIATSETIYPYIDSIYYNDGSSWTNAGKAAMVQAIVSSNIGSIVGFSAGSSGANNRITIAFVVANGYMQTICGSWQGGSEDVPAKYLPNGCDVVNFASTITG